MAYHAEDMQYQRFLSDHQTSPKILIYTIFSDRSLILALDIKPKVVPINSLPTDAGSDCTLSNPDNFKNHHRSPTRAKAGFIKLNLTICVSTNPAQSVGMFVDTHSLPARLRIDCFHVSRHSIKCIPLQRFNIIFLTMTSPSYYLAIITVTHVYL